MKKKFDVLCVGLAVADILVKPISKDMLDVDAAVTERIGLSPGGDALNQSIILSRLGVKAGLAGKVGDDAFGSFLINRLKSNGVDVSNVKVDSSTNTTASIVLIREDGSRSFIYNKGNNDDLSLDDLNISMLEKTKIVSVGSLFQLPLLDKDGAAILFREARKSKVITVADVKYDVRGLGIAGIMNILANTDFIFPNYTEAVYLTGKKEPEKAAEILLDCGVKTVVIKLGADGCLIKTENQCLFLKGYPVEPVDTTGAGDNFVAGFITGLIHGWDLSRCGRFANAVGALSVQATGATENVESYQQVTDFLMQNEKDFNTD